MKKLLHRCDCKKNELPAFYLNKEKIEEYTLLIELAFIDMPFLQKGFTIRDLSQLTGISVHHLSKYINSHYKLHFQDFINTKRIEYLIQKIDKDEWKNLSLEGQAWAIGFRSRTTLFRAFIKLKGKSPSEHLNTLKSYEPKIISKNAASTS